MLRLFDGSQVPINSSLDNHNSGGVSLSLASGSETTLSHSSSYTEPKNSLKYIVDEMNHRATNLGYGLGLGLNKIIGTLKTYFSLDSISLNNFEELFNKALDDNDNEILNFLSQKSLKFDADEIYMWERDPSPHGRRWQKFYDLITKCIVKENVKALDLLLTVFKQRSRVAADFVIKIYIYEKIHTRQDIFDLLIKAGNFSTGDLLNYLKWSMTNKKSDIFNYLIPHHLDANQVLSEYLTTYSNSFDIQYFLENLENKDIRIKQTILHDCLRKAVDDQDEKVIKFLLNYLPSIPKVLISELMLKADIYKMPIKSILEEYQSNNKELLEKNDFYPKNVFLYLGHEDTYIGPLNSTLHYTYINAIRDTLAETDDGIILAVNNGKRITSGSIVDIQLLEEYISLYHDSMLTLVVIAHGNNEDGHLMLGLTGDSSSSAEEIFERISNLLGDKPIDIFNVACRGGAFHKISLKILPPGSTYVSLSDANEATSVDDVDSMFNYIRKKESPKNCINAHCLLLSYLAGHHEFKPYLSLYSNPLIATHDFSIPLIAVLRYQLGRTFSKTEKNKIVKYLKSFFTLDTINKTISAIEGATDGISGKELERNSVALAIAYVLARDQSYLDKAERVYTNSSCVLFPAGRKSQSSNIEILSNSTSLKIK